MKVDVVTSDDIKIYYTGKFQDFTARYIINYIYGPTTCSLVGGEHDWRTGLRWFDPWLGQYSFRELVIVIATGLIPLSLTSIVSTMVMLESSQWLGKKFM